MGPNGAGYAMKLAVNLGLAAYIQGIAELLALGEREGLTLERMLEVLERSADRQCVAGEQEGAVARQRSGDHARSENLTQGHHVGGGDRRGRRHRPAAIRRHVDVAVGRGRARLGRNKDIGELPRFFREHMGQRFD